MKSNLLVNAFKNFNSVPKKIVFCFFLLCPVVGQFAWAADFTTPAITGKISLMDIESSAGKVYLACAVEEEEKQIRFFQFSENKWNEILLPAETRAGGFLQIKVYNEIPFILFDGYKGVTLIRYEKGIWYEVGKPGFAADVSGMNSLNYLIKDGVPYLIFENSTTKKPEIMMLETKDNLQIWTSPDASALIPVNAEQPGICMDLNKSLFTVWFDRKNQKVQVSKLISDDEQLQDMSKGIPAKDVANLVGFFSINNKLFLAYEDNTKSYAITVLRFNDGAMKWEPITTPVLSGTQFRMAANKDIFMLNENGIPVRFATKANTWSGAETIYKNACTGLEICSDGITTYCAFLDVNDSNKLIIKQF